MSSPKDILKALAGKELSLSRVREIRNKSLVVLGFSQKEFGFLTINLSIAFVMLMLTIAFLKLTGIYNIPPSGLLTYLLYPMLGMSVFLLLALKILKKIFGEENIFMIMEEYNIISAFNPNLKNKIEKNTKKVVPHNSFTKVK